MTERGMRPDTGLHRASRELARTMPGSGSVPPVLVETILSWAGLVDPPPRLIVVSLDDGGSCVRRYSNACRGAVSSVIGQLEPSSSRIPPRFGVGVAMGPGRSTRMVVSVHESMVAMAPLPRRLEPRAKVVVRGRLVGARRNPSIEIVEPSGRAYTARANVGPDGSFATQIECAARGKYQVEVMAEGAHGPGEIAANFPLFCATEPPSKVRFELERIDPRVDVTTLARANFMHLNDERKRHGLPPLSWDDRAARVAVDHSKDMNRGSFVGHVSPRTGDASDRFARARIQGTVIRENVALGYGPKGIHESLMSSPGHRVNILAEDVTHVGIGVVLGPADPDVPSAPRPLYLTQNFFKKPGAGAPRDALLAPTIRSRVDEIRKRRRLAAARWDDGLDALAATLAQRVAAGRRLPSGWEQEVFDLGYETVQTHQVSGDFDQLAGIDTFLSRALSAGVGVVRLSGDRGFMMIVLVVE